FCHVRSLVCASAVSHPAQPHVLLWRNLARARLSAEYHEESTAYERDDRSALAGQWHQLENLCPPGCERLQHDLLPVRAKLSEAVHLRKFCAQQHAKPVCLNDAAVERHAKWHVAAGFLC